MTTDGTTAAVEELSDWYDDLRIEADGTITVNDDGVPDLRTAADAVRSALDGDGELHVTGADGTWAIPYEGGEPTGIDRIDGEYTATRPSLPEKLARGLMGLGLWTAIGGLLTALAAIVLETPTSFLGGLGITAVGAIAFGAGLVAFVITPGMTSGPTAGTPGLDLPNFDAVDPIARHALVAVDDAKSRRNEELYQGKNRLPSIVGLYALIAYLFVLAFVNFGWLAVLVLGVLPGLRALLGVGIANALVAVLDEHDDPRVTGVLDDIRSESGHDADPAVYELGESSNPVYENVAFALPELDALVIPKGDVSTLRPGELEALIAHEYRHVVSHYPAVLGVSQAGTYLLPGIALAITGAAPPPLHLGAALLAYFLVASALFAAISRRWERQADDFAAEQASPLDMAFALTKVTDVHVVDTANESLLAGGVAYRSHPAPHRRVAQLIDRATE